MIHDPTYAQGYARDAGEALYPGLWRGLVGAWIPALGPTGGVLPDISGHGKNGIVINADPSVDWVVTERGYGLDLGVGANWISTGVQLGQPSEFSVVLSARVQYISGQDYLADSSGVSTGFGWRLPNVNVQTFFCYRSGGGLSLTNSPFIDQEHAVRAVVMTHERIIVYRNGVEVGTNNDTTGVLVVGEDIAIGSEWTGATSADAIVDSSAIWNRALSPQEIQLLYQDPMALVRPSAMVLAKAPAVVGVHYGPLVDGLRLKSKLQGRAA